MAAPFHVPFLQGVDRNIHLFDSGGVYLGGGFQQTPPQLTVRLFVDMCSHFLRFETMRTRWALFAVDEHGTVGARVSQANAFVAPGHYAVRSRDGHPIAVRLTSERHVRRVRTPQTGSQSLRENQLHFRDAVRSRDRACAITGQRPGTLHDPWRGLMAAHIYPVSRLAAWNQERRAWITDTTDAAMIAPSGLFSAQNGLLLEATTHICFDLYEIAVSPDHGYRVVPFALDSLGVGGLVLSSTTRPARDENRRVSDDILRWHFHQAILRNMRGAGERPWDEDNAGGGPMALVRAGPDGRERMEVEMATRLGAFIEEGECGWND